MPAGLTLVVLSDSLLDFGKFTPKQPQPNLKQHSICQTSLMFIPKDLLYINCENTNKVSQAAKQSYVRMK